MSKEHYIDGGWWVICDRCGRKRRNTDTSKEWTGLMVCADTCLDYRHPQDFVRTKPDDIEVPNARPRPADVFVDLTYDTTSGTQENTIPSGTFDNSL